MTRRTAFWLWLPLALSFTMMMLEGPTVQSAMARLAQPALHLAAFGLVLGISLLIQSPVLMLTSTSIALAADARSYRALRAFMLALNAVLTLLAGAIAFTPLFDLLSRHALGMPPPIVEAARPAMRLMLFWTAAIGWRRFYQGILVRYGQSRLVTVGTVVRLVSTFAVAVGLVRRGDVPGVVVGAYALMAGVLSEALVTHLFAAPVVREHLLPRVSEGTAPLTQARILAFHVPLAGTALLTLVAQPMTAAALARLALPDVTLAAWPVVFATLLVLRSWGLALQETTLAQARDPQAHPALREFAFLIAGVLTAATLLLGFTPLLEAYLHHVIGLPDALSGFVRTGVQLSLLLPAATAVTSWLRGLLVASARTVAVSQGMALNLAVNAAGLGLGVALRLPGIPVASLALTAATLVEYVYLRRQTAG